MKQCQDSAAFGHGTNEEVFVASAPNRLATNIHLELWSATHWRKIGAFPNFPSERPLLEPTIGTEGHMVNALAVSSDDTVVYLAGASALRRWDLRQGDELPPFPVAKTTCLATSGDGQLAAADLNGLKTLAHQLKGAAGSYGFQPISDAAAALVELNAALGANVPVPKGDRNVEGTTPVEETLRALLAGT